MKMILMSLLILWFCDGWTMTIGEMAEDAFTPLLNDLPRNLPQQTWAIRCPTVPEKDEGAITALEFSLDGGALLAGNGHGVVQWFDPATGRKTLGHRVAPHTLGGCGGLAVFDQGRSFVTQTNQNEVSVLDVATGQPRSVLEKISLDKRVFLNQIAVSPKGDLVAGGYSSGEVVIWDVATGRRRATLPPYVAPAHYSEAFKRVVNSQPDPIQSLAFMPDGKTLTSCGGVVRIWDALTGEERDRFEGDERTYWCRMALSPDGNTLALIRNSPDEVGKPGTGEIVLLGLSPKRIVAHWPIGGLGLDLAFLPDRKTLVSLDQEPIVRLWDVAAGKQLDAVRFDRYTHLSTLAIAANGKRIALGGYESAHIFGIIQSLETDGVTLRPWKPQP